MDVENRTIFEGDNLHILRGLDLLLTPIEHAKR